MASRWTLRTTPLSRRIHYHGLCRKAGHLEGTVQRQPETPIQGFRSQVYPIISPSAPCFLSCKSTFCNPSPLPFACLVPGLSSELPPQKASSHAPLSCPTPPTVLPQHECARSEAFTPLYLIIRLLVILPLYTTISLNGSGGFLLTLGFQCLMWGKHSTNTFRWHVAIWTVQLVRQDK